MERPVEPYSTSEDPEQWADIATFETERADRLEKALRKIRGLTFKNSAFKKCFVQAVGIASDALGVKSPVWQLEKMRSPE